MSVTSMEKATKVKRVKKSRRRGGIFDPTSILGYCMMLPAMAVLLMFFAYPLGFEIWSSLTNMTLGNDAKFIGLENYRYLFSDPEFITAAKNSFIYVTIVQLGKFVLGLGIAILLHQKLVARGFWRAVVLVPYAMPGFVAFLIWKLIYNPDIGSLNIFLSQIGLIDAPISFLGDRTWAMPSVIFATIWRGFPFWAIMFLAALQAVPKELYEAAAVDGANAWQRFKNISLPGIRPVILIVFLISTINTINSFEAVWLTTAGGPSDATVILPIFAYKGLTSFQIGQSAAAALSLVPIAIIFTFFILRRMKKD
ncbi:MAG: carbohydrate ABC transporter permease [Actinomycetota bacterium]